MSVEFLPSDEPGASADDWPDAGVRSRRRGWWAFVALLALAATSWALTRSSPSPPHASSPPSVAAAPTPTVATRVAPACRGIPDCSVHAAVPRAIERLAQVYLPAGVHLRVRTVVQVGSLTMTDLLVERDIDAVVDSVTVLIRIRRDGASGQQHLEVPTGVSSLVLHQINSGFVVQLQFLAPEAVRPMLSRLRALVRDPRLTTT